MTTENSNTNELRELATSNGTLKSIYLAFETLCADCGLDAQTKLNMMDGVVAAMTDGVRGLYTKYLIECPGPFLSGEEKTQKPEKVLSKLAKYYPLANIKIGEVQNEKIIKLLINLGVLPNKFKFSTINDLRSILKPLSKKTDPDKVTHAYLENDQFGFSFINLKKGSEAIYGVRADLFYIKGLEGVTPGYTISLFITASIASEIVEIILDHLNGESNPTGK